MLGRTGGEREAVRADLVGDVSVGRHAVAADDHRVDRAAGDQPGRRASRRSARAGCSGGRARTTVSRAPWSSGRDSVASTRSSVPAVGQLGDHRERGAAAGRRERAGVAVGEDPAGAGEQVGAVGGDRVRWRLPPRLRSRALRRAPRRAPVGARSTGAAYTRSTAHAQVDRRRAGVAQESPRLARALSAEGSRESSRRRRRRRRRRSAARRGSPGGGSPRPRRRRCEARAARSRQGSAVWSIARSAAPSKRSATSSPGVPRVVAIGRCYPGLAGYAVRAARGRGPRPEGVHRAVATSHARRSLVAGCACPRRRAGRRRPDHAAVAGQPGMNCTGETVVQGTTISSFNVQVIDVVDAPGEGARILVQVSGPAVDATGVAEGFSGSPVYCPDRSATHGERRRDLRGDRPVRQQRRAGDADRADARRAGRSRRPTRRGWR